MGLLKLIKRKIIYSAFKKKKANKPFNIDESELFVLPKDADPVINNSFFFGGYSLSNKSSIVLRLGERNLDYSEVFVFYKKNNLFLVTPKDYYPVKETPLKVNCVTPGKSWEAFFDGKLMDQATKKLHDVKFSIQFENRLPIYDFFYSLQNPYMIEATANCKWTSSFREETAKNDQRHYEQVGWIRGKISVDGKEEIIDMPGGRDHSFGSRNWDYMNDHIWLFAFDEEGRVFNYSLVNYPLLKNINCGYSDINGEFASLKKVISNDYQNHNGQGPDTLNLELILDNGQKLKVSATRDANNETHYQGGDYYFQEGLGEFLINGKKAYGSIEYGFNKNPSRWEINK